MALPKKLKYLNLFNDGHHYLGVVSSLTLPKLTRKLENYRGGGMSGAASVDFGLDDDALTLEWTIGGMDELVLQQWAARPISRCALPVHSSATTPATCPPSKCKCAGVTKSLILVSTSKAKTQKPRF